MFFLQDYNSHLKNAGLTEMEDQYLSWNLGTKIYRDKNQYIFLITAELSTQKVRKRKFTLQFATQISFSIDKRFQLRRQYSRLIFYLTSLRSHPLNCRTVGETFDPGDVQKLSTFVQDCADHNATYGVAWTNAKRILQSGPEIGEQQLTVLCGRNYIQNNTRHKKPFVYTKPNRCSSAEPSDPENQIQTRCRELNQLTAPLYLSDRTISAAVAFYNFCDSQPCPAISAV